MHVILQPNSVLYNWFCLISFVLPADESTLGLGVRPSFKFPYVWEVVFFALGLEVRLAA